MQKPKEKSTLRSLRPQRAGNSSVTVEQFTDSGNMFQQYYLSPLDKIEMPFYSMGWVCCTVL